MLPQNYTLSCLVCYLRLFVLPAVIHVVFWLFSNYADYSADTEKRGILAPEGMSTVSMDISGAYLVDV